ncbi:unnamed protein product [Medioppia subpectinata]|uniref:Inorganic phosphate cotransporter n=1 Tax=Medioppia subpectinata TaxID=1979941 RepID=A0A7R9LG00_9ACAR|nr:unnamed protein product [Medioppia subpectinata]CAG2117928.1 unnamed protein product [Medioppia subpectinata]
MSSLTYLSQTVIAWIAAHISDNLRETMFIVAAGLNGCHFSSLKSTHVDMAPDFAGTLYGVTNSMAGVSGLIAPQFAAYFLNNGHTLTNWSIIFYTTIIVYILGTVIYLVFGSAKVQDWAVDHNTDTIQLGPKKNGGETFEKSDSTGKH